ncbi:DinB family protein [Mycolicibacterium wolinskyi]|uniref:Mini-circle protein n=1 Tax=Mycolicibacterium wolinskyi TaxID=59750 RepID=A0A1X2FEM3_9MYCO|nr:MULTISPECIES: DinB family protein [Mycolicibacterium]MCV7290536.1 DinB family protein [Mycolicibacterium wolinskyi]MCV7291586.1 DinB family protein [Mycolicibacterium goodii]ORX16874.1 mini-circle protein [Mycolicibacterium wolinskyi]
MARRRKDMPPPATGGSEREVLLGFLDYLRECVIAKVQGAPEPLVRQPGVPSGTNLLGLLNHLVNVERFTFLGEAVADWPATFHAAADSTVQSLTAEYERVTAQANEAIESCADLESPCARPTRQGQPPSMRWALTHMIEETGRHAGHMDILRELIDGSTGR